jgi:hypothetical protein
MGITSYDSLNNIPETSFIAGTDKVFTFTCYNENGGLLDISSGTSQWLLCPAGDFGQPVLIKEGAVVDANNISVTISAEETLSLSGKYIQQIIITDFYGATYRPGQGSVIILPAIGQTNVNHYMPYYLTNSILKLYGSIAGYSSFQTPSVTDSVSYTLPSGDGESGQTLTTDGAGNLSWDRATFGDLNWFSVKDYGATGDGTTDDTGAIKNAVSAWINNAPLYASSARAPGVLYFPPGNYLITDVIPANISHNTMGGCILGYGAVLQMSLTEGISNYGLSINTLGGGYSWRNLTIEGLTFRYCGLKLNSSADTSEAIYGYTLRNLTLEVFQEHGIYVSRAYEGSLQSCHLSSEENTEYYCIYFYGSGGNPSSTEVLFCTTRGGLNGLRCETADIKIIGGTYLIAHTYGIYLANGGFLDGVHIENNWNSLESGYYMVRVATTTNITLNDLQTIDEVSLEADDIVLVKDQTAAEENGIYVVVNGGAWTRHEDYDTWDDFVGAQVTIETGEINRNYFWLCTATAGGTLGVTNIVWEALDNAGIYLSGRGTAVHIKATSNDYMTYAISTYIAEGQANTFIGGARSVDTRKYLYLNGQDNSTAVIIGDMTYDEHPTWRSSRSGKVVKVGDTSFVAPRIVTPELEFDDPIYYLYMNLEITDICELTIDQDISIEREGTPVDGQKFIMRLKDDGSARALTWSSEFNAIGCALPSTTTPNKQLYIGGICNIATGKLDVLAVVEET